MNVILEKIKRTIENSQTTLKEAKPGDKKWTRQIFGQIVKEGNKAYYTCCSTFWIEEDPYKPHSCEWLYDLCWFELTENKNIWDFKDIKKIKLVLESEWENEYEILDDFLKLVQAKAENKIMIYPANNKIHAEQYNRTFRSLAEKFASSEKEQYLLACYLEDSGKFEFEDFIEKI